MFSLRIVTTSHYQASPIPGLDTTHSEFRDSPVKRVPVLRIFGSTPAGQKTCMHIHGVFPYLYVPYDGTQPVDRYLRQFASSLDKALNVANRTASANFHHVYKISLVSGISMYGYHPQEEQFLKIYLYNPNNVRKAADLLLGGAVMNKSFQPHESHIPYPLQLFIDYNLYGMNLVNVATLRFRKRTQGDNNENCRKSFVKDVLAQDASLSSSSTSSVHTPWSSSFERVWQEDNIPSELWLPASFERQSTCELEVDVVAADITNRHELASSIGGNPGLAALWEDERQRRKEVGESSQIEPDASQERKGIIPSDSETKLIKQFLDIVKQQQANRTSQSDESILLSQPSLTASQLERHVSRDDSIVSSQSTVILSGASDNTDRSREEEVDEHIPIISMDSIKRVVSISQSFSLQPSQRSVSETQEHSMADILASLLEESGPPPSQLISLEEQDSILNQSTVLDSDEEKQEEEETFQMTQIIVKDDEGEHLRIAEGTSGLHSRSAKQENAWMMVDDIVMKTDDEDSGDEVDLLPQFDGASDKPAGPQKKSDQNQTPAQSSSSSLATDTVSGTGDTIQSQASSHELNTSGVPDMTWRPGAAGRGMGPQGYMGGGGGGTWTQQSWPQQSNSSSWQNQGWPQQQQYQNWPQHQQQMPSTGYPSQQTSFKSTSPASASFQSPPHNPYSSPTHQQTFQTPSQPASQHQYQFPPYQSPPSSQSFQHPYQSPYQSPASSQGFHSPQPYHSSSGQPYQSPSASQPYQSPPANQPYQSPTANQTYPPPVASQTYPSSAASKPFQSPTGSQPYHSPTTSLPYQSPPASQTYQSPQCTTYQSQSSPMFPAPYQSPAQCAHQSSPQQPYPPPYQSPGHSGGRYPSQSTWGTQGYPGYYQSHMSAQVKNAQGSSGLVCSQETGHADSSGHLVGPKGQTGNQETDIQSMAVKHSAGGVQQAQQHHSGSSCQSGNLPASGSCSFQQQGGSQPLAHQQQSAAGSQTQSHQANNVPSKTKGSSTISASDTIGCQSPVFSSQQTLCANTLKEESISTGFKSPQPSNVSPLQGGGAKSQFELGSHTTVETTSSHSLNTSTPLSDSCTSTTQPKAQEPDYNIPSNAGGESKSSFVSNSKFIDTPPVTKISTLEFKPNILTDSGLKVSKESASKSSDSSNKSSGPNSEKPETSTPMIQQLLMEEPARMNIKKEDRDAAMKKPMASPTPPKPKKKYKSKASGSQAGKTTVRPRSISLSSPAPPPMMGFGSYPQHPLMNPQMIGRPGRSQSISLPFNSEQRMPSPIPNYGWQQQQHWKQQNLLPASQWQQQQVWGNSEWQNYNNPMANSADSGPGTAPGRLQHRSFSADSAQPSFYHNNAQPNQTNPFPDNQSQLQNNSTNTILTSGSGKQTCPNLGNIGDKSSLSSLFQLVSDVGSEDAGWENATSSVVPNLFHDNNESGTPKSTPTSDLNQASPSVKDFITLETPFKQANSDTTGVTSSEESDRMDADFPGDPKPRAINRSQSLSSNQRLGKLNKHKKLGPLHKRLAELGSLSGPMGPNPAYTYTFHVPTPVFKKLKFLKSPDMRKHSVKVVRMHPMDARRYSLLKIGREIVKVIKLTEADLARYNVTFPPPSQYVSPDGSTNRVNLDIPTFSTDKRSDSGGEESTLSKFDTDFPPNKVAPPSSFHASQVSASMSRASSTMPRNSPVSADWMRQFPGHQSANYNGGFSPGSQQGAYSPQPGGFSPQQGNFAYPQQSGERSFPSYSGHQPMTHASMNRHFGSQPPDCSAGMIYQQYNQKGNSYYPHSSSTHPPGNYYPNQPGTYMNRSHYPQQPQQQQYYQQQQSYQPQQQYQLQQHQQQQFQQQQQQPQTGYNGAFTEPKNELRSPGQHGLVSRIDSGSVHGQSGDDESECTDKNTTETSPVNTRVNAQRWDNHAEHMANYAATNHRSGSSSLHQAVYDHTESVYKNTENHIAEEESHLVKDEQGRRESVPETLINTEQRPCISQSSASSAGKDTDCDTPFCHNASHCDIDTISGTQTTCMELRTPEGASSFTTQRGRKGKVSSRKNVKSLRLKIPEPLVQQTLLNNTSEPNEYLDKASMTSSQQESDDESENGSVSSMRRSTRSSSQDDESKCPNGGRPAIRQAKLRSIYSSKPKQKRSRQRRMKKQEPLKEGVHYIVIGKFKGHQTMLVKVKQLEIGPLQTVSAKEYQKSTAHEIVRIVVPEYDTHSTPGMDNTDLLGETQSDMEQEKTEFGNIEGQEEWTSKTYQRPSRGRSKKHAKYRSAYAVQCQEAGILINKSFSHFLESESQSKNVLAGPTNGASKNSFQALSFSKDEFFSRFKESFIKHHQTKESPVYIDTHDPEHTVFAGVGKIGFHNFQRKFWENIHKLKSDEYSSSSDDEDEILDETILKQKIDAPEIETCQPLNNVTDDKSTEPGWFPEGKSQVDENVCARAGFTVSREDFYETSGTGFTVSREDFYETPGDKCFATSSSEKGTLEFGKIIPHYVVANTKNSDLPYPECFPVDSRENSAAYSSMNYKIGDHGEMNKELSRNENISIGHLNLTDDCVPSAVTGTETVAEKEDYLKQQMAFFEDISSDSDTNDTIIMDTYIDKQNVVLGDSSGFRLLPTYPSSRSDPLAPCTAIMNMPPETVLRPEEMVTDSQIDMAGTNSPTEILNVRSELMVEGQVDDIQEPPTTIICGSQSPEDSDESEHESVFETLNPSKIMRENKLLIKIKDGKEYSVQEIPPSTLTPLEINSNPGSCEARTSDKNLKPQEADIGKMKVNISGVGDNSIKSSDVDESLTMDHEKSVDSDYNSMVDVNVRKHGKGMKKSRRDKGSKFLNHRQFVEGANSSSNDEMNEIAEIYSPVQTKRLRQRQQNKYIYYGEDLDTSEDESSDSSDEDFGLRSSQRKPSKSNRKQKGDVSKDKQAKRMTPLTLEKSGRGGHRSRASRGKKKKPPGGDKLLNSLSLLHMATLANLTETQSDPVDSQSLSEEAGLDSEDISSQYAARATNDHNSVYNPSLETMSFISPQNSDGVEISPPVACSPSDKKKWKQYNRGRSTQPGTIPSSRLLNFSQRRVSLRPGCNGASNLGSRPLPFSRLVNNSASSSPIPSNFSFGNSHEPSQLSEPPHPNEDASTPNTLQLLETRRAQVNCASFSMKDILRLATPDDSMDSDSKDSAAVVRPPEPKRAQVKSTTLSMSDILKLTSVEKKEAEAMEASHSLLSQLANFDTSSTFQSEQPSKSALLHTADNDDDDNGCEEDDATTEASSSLLSRITEFVRTGSKSPQDTTEASQSLLSQLANFNSSKHMQQTGTLNSFFPVVPQPMKDTNSYLLEENENSKLDTSKPSKIEIGREEETCIMFRDHTKREIKTDGNLSMETTDLQFGKPNENMSAVYSSSRRKKHARKSDTHGKSLVFQETHPLLSSTEEILPSKSSPCLSKKSIGIYSSGEMHTGFVQSERKFSNLVISEPLLHPAGTDASEYKRNPGLADDFIDHSTKTKLMNEVGSEKKTSALSVSASQLTEMNKQNCNLTKYNRKVKDTSSLSSEVLKNTTVPETLALAMREIPRISVTYDEPSLNENFNASYTEWRSSRSEQLGKGGTAENMNMKNLEKGLKPLHPLQIPAYPFIGHPMSVPSGQSSFNPALYYPYCWQWPVHTPGSDPAMSPLNLCTTHKSPNNYSPITPTSPISPDYSALIQGNVSSSGLSPPLKKAKPLWYPWLTVEAARNRQDPKSSVYSSKDVGKDTTSKDILENLKNSHAELPSLIKQSSEKKMKEQVLSHPRRTKNEALNTFDSNKNSHRIKDLLHCHQSKSSTLKIDRNALSSCKTVSQFLGTVIDTAFEQEHAISTSHNENVPREISHVLSSKAESLSYFLKKSDFCGPSENTPQNGEFRRTHYASDLRSNNSVAHKTRVKNLQDGAEDLSCKPHESFTQEPVSTNSCWIAVRKQKKSVLEKDRKLREQFGLSSHSDLSFSESARISLTDRLVTKLIKGDNKELSQREPHDASGSNRSSSSSQKGTNKTFNENQNFSEHSVSRTEREGNDEKRDSFSINGGTKRSAYKPAQTKGRELTLRPVKLVPSRKSVEENLVSQGLNTVQPPAAFCSDLQDLPDRPMEHGGRVLKVESRRLCQLTSFTSAQCLIGIKGWRIQSVSASKLLASQPQSKPLWERLEQEPYLRFLLSGEHPIVVVPVCSPPSRASVLKWLQNRVVELRAMKLKQDPSAQEQETENNLYMSKQYAETDVMPKKPEDEGKSVTFSQLPQHISSGDPGSDGGDNPCHVAEASICLSPTSEGNSSAITDTDLDISQTPTDTPAPMTSITQICADPQDAQHKTPVPVASSTQRKRKLRFASDRSLDSNSRETFATDLPTQENNARAAKKKREILNEFSPPKNVTPAKCTSRDLFDPTCTPVTLPQHQVSIFPETESSVTEISKDHKTGEDSQASFLRHMSTNTQNMLRKNILTSQTQRQFSVLGLSAAEVSQIEGPTPKNVYGFKVTDTHVQDRKALHKYQYVTALSLELHVETRGDLRPDPEFDSVKAIFYSVFDDIPAEKGPRNITGVIVMDLDSWHKVTERNMKDNKPQSSSESAISTSQHSSFQKASLDTQPLAAQDSRPVPSPSPSTHHSVSSTEDKPPTTSLNQITLVEKPHAASIQKAPSPAPLPVEKGKGRTLGQPPPNLSDAGTSSETLLEKSGVHDVEVTYVQDEMDLIATFVQLVAKFDPDILVGYEIQLLSWGYLLQRAAQLNVDLCSKIARVQDAKGDNRFSPEKDQWGADHMSEIHVAGRVVLNLWRILRHEVALNVYTFENAAFHILHRRIPLYSFRSLTKWFNDRNHLKRWRVFDHYIVRVQGQLEIINQLDLLGKTSEFARVFGLEFYDVLARGSQLRVESMMLRIAKPLNFVAVSPSVNQRARQRAAECIALNLEPESKYYTSPVVVLDFQSLYPSIMIAYNYCFSTCLGRLKFLENAHEGPIEFGCTSLNLTPATLKTLRSQVTISPNGVVFVKSSVRKGVLPRMVEEILNTRFMVKKSMKTCKDDKILTRMFDARQLGLKLIANVTYGYTGASFSGRMPCIEVADSIVRKARESLERAIELVHNTPKWAAHVVYGDTDSLFIHFPGRSKDEAFVLGQEIADAVTAMFPSPMKLRFEKVYLPCVLETKKRYVGFMYETPDQKDPVFDAKGIETVRRDGCSAVSKILERSIKVLFSTHDLSRVRAYVTCQLHKLLEGKVSILDLIFAKEFRGMMGYKPSACVPALKIAKKRIRVDRRSEPRVGERVPYVIVHGSPDLPLIELVREPWELVADTSLRLNASYYITKQILPPLSRIFSLIGVNVFKWYHDMPKVARVGPIMSTAPVTAKQGTISHFFATSHCPVCDAQTKQPVCQQCQKEPQLVVYTLTTKVQDWNRTCCRLAQVCHTCQGIQDSELVCVSMDCPIMFRRVIAKQDLLRADNFQDVMRKYLQF